MIGQDILIKKAKNCSSIVLTGPKGCGKTSLAREIIREVLPKEYINIFDNDNYPDYIYVDGGSKLEGIHSLIDRISTKPHYDKYYVLIDDIDKMTIQGQNAFLKTLEDRDDILFILTVTNKQNVLKTIFSRCSKFSVNLLDKVVILEYLKEKFVEEEEETLDLISDICSGSIGLANEMLERKDLYLSLKDDLENIRTNNFFTLAAKYSDYKEDVLNILSFLEQYIRNKMILGKNIGEYFDIFEMIQTFRKELNHNINLNMMYQNLFMKLEKIG